MSWRWRIRDAGTTSAPAGPATRTCVVLHEREIKDGGSRVGVVSGAWLDVFVGCGGCSVANEESTASSESAQTAACACTGEPVGSETVLFDDIFEKASAADPPSADDWDWTGDEFADEPVEFVDASGNALSSSSSSSGSGGVSLASGHGLKLTWDEWVFVGNIKVELPQLKGDRCHAGDVHIKVTDGQGNVYKLKPSAGGWVTADGRPGPSKNVWKKIIGNAKVQAALSKLARAAGFCTAAFMLFGYDNYVSAGETAGYTILDKIKTMRSMQDICSPDENGVMQPRLPRRGTIPGGAGSGRDLQFESGPPRQAGSTRAGTTFRTAARLRASSDATR